MAEVQTEKSKVQRGLMWLGTQLLVAARDGCLALATMTALSMGAVANITPENLTTFGSLWDVSVADHEGLIRAAFFGVAMVSAVQSAVGYAAVSFTGRILFAGAVASYRRYRAHTEVGHVTAAE